MVFIPSKPRRIQMSEESKTELLKYDTNVIKEGFNITKSYHTNNVRKFVGDAMHWHNEDGWLGWKNFAGYQLAK